MNWCSCIYTRVGVGVDEQLRTNLPGAYVASILWAIVCTLYLVCSLYTRRVKISYKPLRS